MCLHAFQVPPDQCSLCSPRRRPSNSVSLGVERKPPESKHLSMIPARFHKTEGPQRQVDARCVGCGGPVNPAFCYSGSVLSDLIHTALKTSSTTPVLGVVEIETYQHATAKGDMPLIRTRVLGGHTVEGVRKIAFRKRTKGLICDSCAACTLTVDNNGEKVPLVMTDARGGFLGETARGSEAVLTKFRRGPAFNTRFTQGRRGKRV